MKKTLFYLIIYSMILMVGSFSAGFVCAQEGEIVDLPDPLDCNGDCNILGIINKITDALKIFVIPVGTIMIIIGGIQYLVSAGNEQRIAKAKNTLLYAVIGIVIVLSVDFIVELIREILTQAT